MESLGPGIEPVSRAPAGRFLTTGLPGQSLQKCFNLVFSSSEFGMLCYCVSLEVRRIDTNFVLRLVCFWNEVLVCWNVGGFVSLENYEPSSTTF